MRLLVYFEKYWDEREENLKNGGANRKLYEMIFSRRVNLRIAFLKPYFELLVRRFTKNR